MTNVLANELRRILDLDNPFDEANKKLSNCYMFVDGKLLYVREYLTSGTIHASKFKGHDVRGYDVRKSLEVFMPEPGIYTLNNGIGCLIYKSAEKQWFKSFNTRFHMGYAVDSGLTRPVRIDFDSEICKSLAEAYLANRHSPVYVDKDQRIWFMDKLVGRIDKSDEIVCTNLLYKQELIDWSKTL